MGCKGTPRLSWPRVDHPARREHPHDQIEIQLAHTQGNAVSAAYDHAQYLKQRTKMMQDWADFLDAEQRGARILQMQTRLA
jgi:hypothetical protein